MAGEVHELSFGRVTFVSENVFLAETNPDTELTVQMVKEFYDLLDAWARPVGVLVDCRCGQSYSFDAMKKFGTSPWIRAVAILAPSKINKVVAQSVISISASKEKEKPIFENKEEALAYLNDQMKVTGSAT